MAAPQPKTYINVNGSTVDASEVTVPSDRTFRGAWNLSANVIGVDMDKAKDIWRNKLREDRKAKFTPLDDEIRVLSRKELSNDSDNARKTRIGVVESKAQEYRDVPEHADIDAASTPDELKALTLDTLVTPLE